MALDYYEERKWKKACGYIIAHDAKKLNQKKEKNNKIRSLYNKIFSLYITINQYSNVSELFECNNNDRLNDYLYDNINSNNFEEMVKDLFSWKNQLKQIENEKKIYKIIINNDQQLINVFNYINNFINIQEETIKKIFIRRNNINKLQFNELNVFDLSYFAELLKQANNINFNGNHNYYNYIIENKPDINYNEINCNVRNKINKFNTQLNQDIISIENISINNNIINNNSFTPPLPKNNYSVEKSKNKFNLKNNNEKCFEKELNNEFNPLNLVMDLSNGITYEEIADYFKNNSNYGNCFSMPVFKLDKFMKNNYNIINLNANQKNLSYTKLPSTENNENILANKNILNGMEINEINNDIKKTIVNYEQSCRYNNLTPLQKLVILYGVFTTRNNPFLINFILNSYYLTRCLMYNINEINYISAKVLNEIGIEYNCAINKNDIFIFDIKKNHYLGSSQTIELKPAFCKYNNNLFKFNNAIQKIIKINYYNIFDYYKNNRDFFEKNNKFNIINKNISLQKSIFLADMITHNPYIIEDKRKSKFLKSLINYFKELFKTIKETKNNNKSKYNYFTGKIINDNQRQKNDINYKEIKENKNKLLNKNNVLKSLKQHKNEFKTFSIKTYKEQINKKTNKNIINIDNDKISVLDIVNKYSEYNMNKSWKTMKNIWCQDNYRYNPMFKFQDINTLDNINSKSKNNGLINENVLNNYKRSEDEYSIEFGPIINFNINQ